MDPGVLVVVTVAAAVGVVLAVRRPGPGQCLFDVSVSILPAVSELRAGQAPSFKTHVSTAILVRLYLAAPLTGKDAK